MLLIALPIVYSLMPTTWAKPKHKPTIEILFRINLIVVCCVIAELSAVDSVEFHICSHVLCVSACEPTERTRITKQHNLRLDLCLWLLWHLTGSNYVVGP